MYFMFFLWRFASNFHRPQQPGFSELPIVTDLDIGLCIAFCLRFASVADETILPGVDHRDLKSVPADPELARSLDAEPGSPLLRIELKLTAFSGDIVEYRLSHCKLGHLKLYVS